MGTGEGRRRVTQAQPVDVGVEPPADPGRSLREVEVGPSQRAAQVRDERARDHLGTQFGHFASSKTFLAMRPAVMAVGQPA